MSKEMEEFFAIRDGLKGDDELMSLASLVGTDAKSPKDKLADYIAGIIMSHRESQFEAGIKHARKDLSDLDDLV